MRLDQGRFDLNSGNFGSPPHQVVDRFGFTNTVSVPSFGGFGSGFGFGAYAFTNQISSTSFVVQVVFVRTNVVDTNLAVQVGFRRDFADGGAFATVEFSYPEF